MTLIRSKILLLVLLGASTYTELGATNLSKEVPSKDSDLQNEVLCDEVKTLKDEIHTLKTQNQQLEDKLTTPGGKLEEKLESELHTLKTQNQQLEVKLTTLGGKLEGKRENLENELTKVLNLDTEKPVGMDPSKLVQSPIAFSVGLTVDDSAGLGDPKRVPYDQVLLNHGDAYDSVTHEFKVPVRGLYYFDVSMGPRKKSMVILTVNGQYRAMASDHAVDDLYYSGDAVSAMLYLEVGDSVWVELENGDLHSGGSHDPYFPYAPRNVFTGFLYAEL